MKKFQPILKNCVLYDKNGLPMTLIYRPLPLSSNFNEIYRAGDFEGVPYQKIIGGRLDKMFYTCKSDCLKQMFIDIKNGSSYVTAYNDIIKREYDTKSKKMPLQNVRVLIKRVSILNNNFEFNEELCSKTAVLFDVPTAYNKAFSDVDNTGEKHSYVLSANFVEKPNKFKNLTSMLDGNMHFRFDSLSKFHNLLKDYNLFDEECRQEIERQFVKQYLFRRYIIKDGDISTGNIGFICDENNKVVELAPAFDYEFAFTKFSKEYDALIHEDLRYIYKNHTEEIVEFAKKAKNVLDCNIINKKYFRELDVNDSVKLEHMIKLNSNINDFYEAFNKVKSKDVEFDSTRTTDK